MLDHVPLDGLDSARLRDRLDAGQRRIADVQHRALPSLRKRATFPEVQLHPEAAEDAPDWRRRLGPEGSVRARASLNKDLDPRVAVGEHGWWQACAEIGTSGNVPPVH